MYCDVDFYNMQADRFVTLCFIYSGLILLAQYLTVHHYTFEFGGLAQLGVALSILGVGVVRLLYPQEEEQNPAEYGLFAYGMVALSLFLTVIFLAQLLII